MKITMWLLLGTVNYNYANMSKHCIADLSFLVMNSKWTKWKKHLYNVTHCSEITEIKPAFVTPIMTVSRRFVLVLSFLLWCTATFQDVGNQIT